MPELRETMEEVEGRISRKYGRNVSQKIHEPVAALPIGRVKVIHSNISRVFREQISVVNRILKLII